MFTDKKNVIMYRRTLYENVILKYNQQGENNYKNHELNSNPFFILNFH